MLKIIKTESEYEDALARAYELIQKNITEENDEANELEILTLLIEHYEKQHYSIPHPSSIAANKFRLEQIEKPVS